MYQQTDQSNKKQKVTLSIMVIVKVIAAEGEHKASRALRHAAEVITDSPAALQVQGISVALLHYRYRVSRTCCNSLTERECIPLLPNMGSWTLFQ